MTFPLPFFLTRPITSYTNSGGTGDRTASITVTSSASTFGYSGAPDSNFVDGASANNTTDGSGFLTDGMTIDSSKWLQFDFGSGVSKYIDEVTFKKQTTANQGTWKWQGSADASSWVDVSGSTALSGATSVVFTLTTAPTGNRYRYYRMLGVSGTANSPGASEWLHEVEFKIAA